MKKMLCVISLLLAGCASSEAADIDAVLTDGSSSQKLIGMSREKIENVWKQPDDLIEGTDTVTALYSRETGNAVLTYTEDRLTEIQTIPAIVTDDTEEMQDTGFMVSLYFVEAEEGMYVPAVLMNWTSAYRCDDPLSMHIEKFLAAAEPYAVKEDEAAVKTAEAFLSGRDFRITSVHGILIPEESLEEAAEAAADTDITIHLVSMHYGQNYTYQGKPLDVESIRTVRLTH